VISLEFGGETLLYHTTARVVHRLDPVASIVWRLLDGGVSVDDLVGDLATAFAADPLVVRNDLNKLLERLETASLLAGGQVPKRPGGEPAVLTNPPSP
jgi:hypothetical protein